MEYTVPEKVLNIEICKFYIKIKKIMPESGINPQVYQLEICLDSVPVTTGCKLQTPNLKIVVQLLTTKLHESKRQCQQE